MYSSMPIERLHRNLEPKCLLVNSVSLPDLVSYSYIFLKKLKGGKERKELIIEQSYSQLNIPASKIKYLLELLWNID